MVRRLVVVACAIALSGIMLAPQSAQAATPLCFGKSATIVGTAGPDYIVGTNRADVIWGGGGNDIIWGDQDPYDGPEGAADLVCGYTGDDRLRGSWGNDKLNGGDGHDSLAGDFGADVLQGNAGNDRVEGDFGESDSDYGSGDVLRGQGGHDVLSDLGKGNLDGGPGNDTVNKWSCGGGSVLHGGTGDDTLRAYWWDAGGYGCSRSEPADNVYGDDGRDTAEVSGSDVVRTVESVTRYIY
jgi:Ca2+-binding RTX toxin-like protein